MGLKILIIKIKEMEKIKTTNKYNSEQRIIFTGSVQLQNMIKEVDKSVLPITAKIIKQDDDSYIFSSAKLNS